MECECPRTVSCVQFRNLIRRSSDCLWCLDCEGYSAARCLAEHDVRNSKGVLRQCIQDVVPKARQQLDSLQDGLQDGLVGGLQDGSALAVLRLVRGASSTCSLTMRLDSGDTFRVEWHEEKDFILQALVVALAVSGRLLQVSCLGK